MFTGSKSIAFQLGLEFLSVSCDYERYCHRSHDYWPDSAVQFRTGEFLGRMEAFHSAYCAACGFARVSPDDFLAVVRSCNRYMNNPRVYKVS